MHAFDARTLRCTAPASIFRVMVEFSFSNISAARYLSGRLIADGPIVPVFPGVARGATSAACVGRGVDVSSLAPPDDVRSLPQLRGVRPVACYVGVSRRWGAFGLRRCMRPCRTNDFTTWIRDGYVANATAHLSDSSNRRSSSRGVRSMIAPAPIESCLARSWRSEISPMEKEELRPLERDSSFTEGRA